MDWLKDILPKLAELLKLQDPDSIKLELVYLMSVYPDLRYSGFCCGVILARTTVALSSCLFVFTVAVIFLLG